LRFGARCDRALAAAVLLAFEVHPFPKTFEAAFAAFALVLLCLGTSRSIPGTGLAPFVYC
jgi:hypothetical protein